MDKKYWLSREQGLALCKVFGWTWLEGGILKLEDGEMRKAGTINNRTVQDVVHQVLYERGYVNHYGFLDYPDTLPLPEEAQKIFDKTVLTHTVLDEAQEHKWIFWDSEWDRSDREYPLSIHMQSPLFDVFRHIASECSGTIGEDKAITVIVEGDETKLVYRIQPCELITLKEKDAIPEGES